MIVGVEGVLGWSVAGEWRTIADGPVPASAGDTYQIIYLDSPVSSVAGSAPSEGCEFVDNSAQIDVGFVVTTWPTAFPVAVSADWDLIPNELEILGTDSASYKAIASELLAGQSIDDPDPKLTQVIRTDLEGDGIDEILIGAERNATGSLNPAAVDDYSILFLRKVVEGDVQTAILAVYVVEEPPGEGFIVALDTLRFSAIADLNGDGRMEIVYTDQYYEGSSTIVLDYVDDDLGPVPVLTVGCGA